MIARRFLVDLSLRGAPEPMAPGCREGWRWMKVRLYPVLLPTTRTRGDGGDG